MLRTHLELLTWDLRQLRLHLNIPLVESYFSNTGKLLFHRWKAKFPREEN